MLSFSCSKCPLCTSLFPRKQDPRKRFLHHSTTWGLQIMSSNMEAGTQEQNHHHHPNNNQKKAMMKTTLLIFNAIILSIGNTAGPLLIRLYFLRGGKRKWLSSWLETGGWPIILIPLSISYIYRHRRSKEGDGAAAKVFLIKPRLFAACVVLGLLTGLDDYMYAYGSSLLPVSTSALLISSQLAFQAGFALLLVKHKFTPFSINAVVLLTVGALILGLHSNGDRPANESQKEYFVGFFIMLGAAALYGFVLPLIELAYMKAKQAITYTLVMEVQLVIGFFATAFCTVGMLVNNDFKAISREGREFELGEAKYYILLVSSAIIWQCFFLGAVGVIATSSSLHAGVVIAVLIPATELLGVLFYKEKFNAEKGVSLGLALWGFVSYFYGEYKNQKVENKELVQAEVELPHS